MRYFRLLLAVTLGMALLTGSPSAPVAAGQGIPVITQPFTIGAPGNGPVMTIAGQTQCSIAFATGATFQATALQSSAPVGQGGYSPATQFGSSGSISAAGTYAGTIDPTKVSAFTFAVTALSGIVSGNVTCAPGQSAIGVAQVTAGLPLSASTVGSVATINLTGTVPAANLPGTVAYTNANNNFSASQTVNGYVGTSSAGLYINGAQAAGGTYNLNLYPLASGYSIYMDTFANTSNAHFPDAGGLVLDRGSLTAGSSSFGPTSATVNGAGTFFGGVSSVSVGGACLGNTFQICSNATESLIVPASSSQPFVIDNATYSVNNLELFDNGNLVMRGALSSGSHTLPYDAQSSASAVAEHIERGTITFTAASSGTATFAVAYSTAPVVCTISVNSATPLSVGSSYTTSTTGITIYLTVASTTTMSYICIGS